MLCLKQSDRVVQYWSVYKIAPVETSNKSFEILTRNEHAQSKFLCQKNLQFYIWSVFLPISTQTQTFLGYLPDYVKYW